MIKSSLKMILSSNNHKYKTMKNMPSRFNVKKTFKNFKNNNLANFYIPILIGLNQCMTRFSNPNLHTVFLNPKSNQERN